MASECILRIPHNYMTEVLLKNHTGTYPDIEEFDQLKNFGGYAIGTFRIGGTGFIVKKQSDDIEIATAAHVFSNEFTFRERPLEFFISTEKYLAVPTKSSVNWSDPSNFYTDPITGVPLSFPEDWVICKLRRISKYRYTNNLVPLQILEGSKLVNNGANVLVIGYPNELNKKNLVYCAPSATKKEKKELLDKNLLADGPFFFKGKVVSASNEVICADCSTINGMSGSPLFITEEGRLKVIGLLHGSRPSLIHSYSTSLINEFNFSKLQELVYILENKSSALRSYKYKEQIEDSLGILRRHLRPLAKKHRTDLESTLFSLYNLATVIEEDSGNPSTYNTFISSRLFIV